MIVAGVDVGAATAEAIIWDRSRILGKALIPTGAYVARAAEQVIDQALKDAACKREDLQTVVSTGYGRRAVGFADKTVTEILCHATGVSRQHPDARTVIDIGGQDSKVIGLNHDGSVTNFAMNDKCAAGTGRFLEVIAHVLGTEIDKIGALSLTSASPCAISSTCTVFAESEMVSLRACGQRQEDILAGVHQAMAYRIAIMGNTVRYQPVVVFTGGVAANTGIKMALEKEIGLEILVPEEHQFMGALGAAILAENHRP